jgi:hypothetical protein
MVGMLDFFGRDEWGAMFGASFMLFAITGIFLISRTVIIVALCIFGVAFLFTGYKLFFDKKNKQKGDIKEFGDTISGIFKK